MVITTGTATVNAGATGTIALPLLAGKRLLQIVLDIETAGAVSQNTFLQVRTRSRAIVARFSPTRQTMTFIEYTLIEDSDVVLEAIIENGSATNSRFAFSATLIDDPSPRTPGRITEPAAGRIPVIPARR